jgi:DNA-binding NarL/FixJ family response regulator
MPPALRVLLVDDHALFRRGLQLMLRELVEGVEVFEAESCAQAATFVDKNIEIVLLDLEMPGCNGLEALGMIKAAFEQSAVLVISAEESSAVIREAVECGASGFVPKSAKPAVMMSALRLVLDNGIYLPPQVLNAAPVAGAAELHGAATLLGLTDRQMEVLRLALRGAPNKVIARQLDVAEGTVKAHLSTAYRLLNVHNRTEALYCAAKLGLQI